MSGHVVVGPARGVQIEGLVRRYGEVEAVAGISLEVPGGSFTTILGPSGCGKSTTLRCIAGLDRPDAGTIRIGDHIVSGGGMHVPPQARRVGFVFQSYALWPHMSVAGHLAYACRARKVARSEIPERVGEILELVGLGAVGARYPYELSGGQQQRVAVARALASEPEVLLLDEPLSNLDAELRAQMRFELRKVHDRTGVTTILVTHDQAEALSMSDNVVIMEHGKIIDSGDPHDVYDRPARVSTAAFVGSSNILMGTVSSAAEAGSKVLLQLQGTGSRQISLVSPAAVGLDAELHLAIKPEDVEVEIDVTGNGGENELKCVVTNLVYYGSHTLLTLKTVDGGDVELRAWTGKSVRTAVGSEVVARLPSARLVLLRAQGAQVDEG